MPVMYGDGVSFSVLGRPSQKRRSEVVWSGFRVRHSQCPLWLAPAPGTHSPRSGPVRMQNKPKFE